MALAFSVSPSCSNLPASAASWSLSCGRTRASSSPNALSGTAPLNSKKGGQGGILIHVYLGHDELSLLLRGHALQHRTEDAAGAAPGSPEIDQHRHLAGALQHLGLKVAFVDLHCPRVHGAFINSMLVWNGRLRRRRRREGQIC